ncbi:unnamed protein product, partial [Symbiodinium sp. CCMP2456]
AREAQRTSAHALRLCELELRWAQGAEGAALECLQEKEQELGRELRQFERELKATDEALNQFRNGPMASLKVLQEPEIAVVPLKTPTKGKQESGSQVSCGMVVRMELPANGHADFWYARVEWASLAWDDVAAVRDQTPCGIERIARSASRLTGDEQTSSFMSCSWTDRSNADSASSDQPEDAEVQIALARRALDRLANEVQVVAAEFEGSEDDFPDVPVFLSLPPDEVARTTLRLMRKLLCRRSEASAAALAEQRLMAWTWQWLAMEAGQRQELCRLAVQGGASLPAQVQARHLALLIDVHFARSWWEERQQMLALGVACEEAASSEETIRATRRQERGARVWQIAVSAMAVLPDAELDLIGQAAVAEAQLVLSPISMARAVLHLAPSRRRQLMEILIQEGILEESSASRLFRALTALDSMLGTDVLDALLIGMDTVCAGVSWSANALDSIGKLGSSTLSSVGALGSWSYQAICSEGAELGPCEAEEPGAGSDSQPSELCAQELSPSPGLSAAPADPKDFL